MHCKTGQQQSWVQLVDSAPSCSNIYNKNITQLTNVIMNITCLGRPEANQGTCVGSKAGTCTNAVKNITTCIVNMIMRII